MTKPLLGTLTIRHAKPREIDSVIAFYDENPHHGVYMRERDIWADRVESGMFQIIVNDDGHIVGATSSYAHLGNEYNEVGSTRARPIPGSVDRDGIGTYEYMIGWQGIRIFELEAPEKYVMADVQTSLGGVIRRLSGPILQWQQFTPEVRLVNAFESSVDASDGNVNNEKIWLRQPVNRLPTMADWLLHRAENTDHEMKCGGTLRRVVDKPSTIQLARDIVKYRGFFEAMPDDTSWRAAKEMFEAARAGFANPMRPAVNGHIGAPSSKGKPLVRDGLPLVL